MNPLSKLIGKRYMSEAIQYIPTAGAFGFSGFTLLCYFTDWKLVLQHLPYYNTKFPKVEEK